MRIVTNACFDLLRLEKRRPTVPLDELAGDGALGMDPDPWLVDPGETPEDAVQRQEFWEAVESSLKQLHPKLQAVLVLVDIQQLDYAESTQALQVPLGTLKSQVARGHTRLHYALITRLRPLFLAQ